MSFKVYCRMYLNRHVQIKSRYDEASLVPAINLDMMRRLSSLDSFAGTEPSSHKLTLPYV